jgi:sortase A
MATVAVPLAIVVLPSLAQAQEAGGVTVTAVTPTDNLIDGQRLTVNIKSTPDVGVDSLEIRECRLEATYTVRNDVLAAGGNCPPTGVTSSTDPVVSRGFGSGITDLIHSATGANILFHVGSGVANAWSTPNGPANLTCDPDHSCALVVALQMVDGTTQFVELPLTFKNADPLSACGGTATGVIASGASDQLSGTWAGWTQAACSMQGASGAPTRFSPTGEGSAVDGFATGDLDLAYTGAGYNAAVGLLPADAPKRAAVAVPVALDAAVIAVGGGSITPSGDKATYPEVKMTASEVAALFGGGYPWVLQPDNSRYLAGIFSRNPFNGRIGATAPVNQPMLPSEAESSSWFMTNYLTHRASADWIAPRDNNAPRGASASLGTAVPRFPDDGTYTGRVVLQKLNESAMSSTLTDGPIWAMTDLATAKALQMTPVSIDDGNGNFVAPTPESMAAAVATMKPDDNGLLQPDPQAGVSASATGAAPYPLTYVVYALVPSEELVDNSSCNARTDSQALLTNWLEFVTGAGQQDLGAGIAPLTPALAQVAASKIALVGAAPTTGPCAGHVIGGLPPAGAPAGPGGGAGDLAAGFPASGPFASLTGLPRAELLAGGPPPGSLAATSPPGTRPAEAAIAIPAFAGHGLADNTGAVIAVLGIVLITSLAAWITARRGPAFLFAGAGSASASADAPSTARLPPPALVALWGAVAVAGFGLVVYQLGPMLQQRDQRDLLAQYRVDVRHAANETSGLPGVRIPTQAPDTGSPVGILEIGSVKSQQVVVEGVAASDTAKGPGHVPGTAGLGQPGNSVVVARRNAFGGTFGKLGDVRKGSRILVTTTQGQSVYQVRSVRTRTVEPSAGDTSTAPSSPYASTGGSAGASRAKGTSFDTLYGATSDDRLTLVTSASAAPWNNTSATVVVARMMGKPFPPTPQGGRTSRDTGTGGDSGDWPVVVLTLLLYGGAIAAAIALYARMRFRVAYILTISPLVLLTVIAGETLSRLLPAWM